MIAALFGGMWFDTMKSDVLQMQAYNAVADQRSWQALRTFLLDVFGYVTPQNQYTNTTVPDISSSFA